MASERETVDDGALADLPAAYAVALRMRAAGAAEEAIAAALDVPVESVAGLVRIGETKLRNAREEDVSGGSAGDPAS